MQLLATALPPATTRKRRRSRDRDDGGEAGLTEEEGRRRGTREAARQRAEALLGRPGRTEPAPVHVRAEDTEQWPETGVVKGDLLADFLSK
jgi:hypothetical protein